MGRKKMFPDHDLPRSVVGICVAIIADYNRREKEIRKGGIVEPLLSSYQNYNSVIDKALLCIEEGARREYIADIENDRGYRFSLLNREYTSWSYYARKRQLIYEVAVGLGLAAK